MPAVYSTFFDSQYCLTKEKGFGKPQRTETCIFRSLGFYAILTLQNPLLRPGQHGGDGPGEAGQRHGLEHHMAGAGDDGVE